MSASHTFLTYVSTPTDLLTYVWSTHTPDICQHKNGPGGAVAILPQFPDVCLRCPARGPRLACLPAREQAKDLHNGRNVAGGTLTAWLRSMQPSTEVVLLRVSAGW